MEKLPQELSYLDIRAELMRRGHSVRSFARLTGRSSQTVRSVLMGKQTSAPIMKFLDEVLALPPAT